jgi:2'-5' RNA ligase
LFFGIALDTQIRKRLDLITHQLQTFATTDLRGNAQINWVPCQNFHITVKFLGKTPADLITNIITEVAALTAQVDPFSVEVKRLGFFPNEKHPRIVWAGIEEPSGKLDQLYTLLDQKLTSFGFQSEKKVFLPHITLARIKEGKNLSSLITFAHSHDFGNYRVDSLNLYESKTDSSGSIYSVHHSFKLNSLGR